MMEDVNAIELAGVCKKFHVNRPSKSGGSWKDSREKIVLDGIDLMVKRGEIIGILGRNGSGKSTLLKILSKIMYQDSGDVKIRGSVASILELGMGFHQELTGRENIYIKSSMYGFSEKETESIIDSIIEFSELKEQIDDPVRTYSSGMYARLAFSIAINVKCDIVILDEILSVGDASFNVKCRNIFERMKREKKTIIIASHNLSSIESMCDRAAWINNGKIVDIGNASDVCYHFRKDMTESTETIINIANSGDVLLQNRLGIMYRDGIGVEINLDTAEKWLSRASSSGFAEAQVNLGDIMLKKGDIDAARDLYTKASTKGNHEAIIRLMTLNNKNNDKERHVLERLLAESKKGNNRAMLAYADALFKGTGVQQDRVKANEWMLKAAELGNVTAMFNLGINHREGLGVPKDSEASEKWLTLAAENGNARARIELANMFHRGITVERNMNKCIYWYSEAANAGDSNSMLQLGTIYRDGLGVDKDQSKSEIWMKMFARQPLIQMENEIGNILFHNHPIEQNRPDCVLWYNNAADEGLAQAQWQLGIMYRDGLGVVADSKKALEFFTEASKHWHQEAMIEVSLMYLKGKDVEKNLRKAFEYMSKSANMGNANARYHLGTMYRDGIGVDVDLEKARQMFRLSSEYGNTNANLALRNL